ncbi:hypothetical protein WR25_06766 [Diploscapter pachys]|uniref:Uncharacterized protein n=1 Tax=Diploscapter pachys TaxID=2018661 RepID=A0A2A2J3S6_9BILA|nr:hypothetical protein WR25_06766 [Diploscapter pachys]
MEKIDAFRKFANESAEGRCAGIVLGEVKMKTLNCTDAGKEPSRFICERDKVKHEEQQKTSNYMYGKLQQLFDYFGIGGGNKDKDEKKHLPSEIDYEETIKELKEIKSNETEIETTTKKQETSREEQATVNKVLAAVQQPKDAGESTSLKELEEGSGQSEGIQVERNAIEKIEQGEKKINDLIARLESMVKKIEDEEKVKEEKKLKALEVERAALQGKEKEEKGIATTLPANTDHVTAPVNSTVSVTTDSSNATTTTPFTTITTAGKEKGKEKKVEDEDLLVTQKTIQTTTTTATPTSTATTAAPTSATATTAPTSTTTQIPATEEQGREEKRMVSQIEDDFMETNNTAMPVADLTPPLEDCKEEETARERRVKKVLQTVKTYLDRATKDDLLSLLNSTTEENLLQKLEEGIAAANKREFQMAQLLKDHRQEEFLQVEHPTENFMTDEEREALYNRISSTIIRNIEQQKEASKKTTQAPSTTSSSSSPSPSPSTSSTAPSTKSKPKIKGTKTHEVTSSRKSHHPSVKSKKTRKGHKKTKRTKTKTKSTVNGKKISKTKEVKGDNSTVTEGKEKEDEVAESNAVFLRANRVKKGEQELNSTEEGLTEEELNSLTKQEDQITAAYKKTIGEIRKLNAEERQIVKAEQIERRNQRRAMQLAAAKSKQLQNKLEEEEDDEKPDRPFKAAATHKAVTRKAEVIRRKKLREQRRKILLQKKKQRELRRARRNKILKLRVARQKALLEKKRKAELAAKTSTTTATTTTTTTEASTTTKKAKSSRKRLRSKARKLTTTTEEPESEPTDEETEADYYGSEEDSGKYPETEGIEEDIKRERETTTTKEPEATTTKSILSSFPKMSLLKELFEKNKAGSDPLGEI